MLQEKRLGFFMTRNMSISKWEEIGILDREIKPYQEFSKYFNKIYIFTYGINDAFLYSNLFSSNVIILDKPKNIPNLLYSIIIPFIYPKIFKSLNFLKTNQMDGSWTAVIAKKIYNIPLIVRCGYEWLEIIKKLKKNFLKQKFAFYIEKIAYKNADKIILTSLESKNFIIKNFNIKQEKITIIQNYIDIYHFKPLSISNEKRERLIYVGRLEKEKNLENLILALKNTGLNLCIIGEGSKKEQLKKIANLNKVDVFFMGKVSQDRLPIEFNHSKMFILPSLHEGNPKALLEAMSCGLPCIGSNVSGINSVIQNDKNGLLCDIGYESIKFNVLKVLNDEDLQRRIGQNARITIEKNNSLEAFISKELKLYESIL